MKHQSSVNCHGRNRINVTVTKLKITVTEFTRVAVAEFITDFKVTVTEFKVTVTEFKMTATEFTIMIVTEIQLTESP